jgi:DNA helicase-2/ATP-dependent DNA helicase PcrA
MHVARSGLVGGRSGTASGNSSRSSMGCANRRSTCVLPELIEEILERSRLKEHYAAEKDGQDRLENLNELVNAATLFAEDFEHGLEPAGEAQEDVAGVVGTPEQQVLAAFLSHASLKRASAKRRPARTRCSS